MRNEYLDLSALLDELSALLDREQDAKDALSEGSEPADLLDPDDASRLDALRALDSEINLDDAVRNGDSPIADACFEDAMRDLAEDCGMFDNNSQMANYIDWEKWAKDCQSDYTSFDFDGTTWWIRS
jgi:hypothetical protein